MSAPRLRYLFELCLLQQDSEQERAELQELLQDPAYQDLVDEFYSNALKMINPARTVSPETRDQILQSILKTGKKIEELKAPVYSIHFLRRHRWAAAAILIGVSFGTYFLIHNRMVAPSMPIAVNADVSPGGNRAVLTLSNGSKIILDSAHNGMLTQQGNIRIVKTDSGKLAYQASSTASSVVAYNTMTTPRGGQYQLVLSDGTKVWLNAASSITYPTAFTISERKVTITGEAYFEVTHSATKPFKVIASGIEVQDIGTHFDINAYGDDDKSINTTLLEGSVKVVDITMGKPGKELKPGEQAVINPNLKTLVVKKDVDLNSVMAWKNGKMILTDGTVKQVMNQISRWYDMDIEYAGKVPDSKFYGSIRRDVPLSTVLYALKKYGITTIVEGKKIIVQ